MIEERTVIQAGKEDRNFTPVTDDDGDSITAQVITPIICEGDAIGAVIIMSREPRAKFSDPELRLAATAAGFSGGRWKAKEAPGSQTSGISSPDKALKRLS